MKYLFLLLLPSIAFCASKEVSSSYTDFSGGLNNSNPSIYIQPSESQNLINVVIDNPIGVLKQRNGYIEIGNTPSGNPITAMYEYTKADGSRALILSDNISVWQTFDGVNFSTITTDLQELSVPYFKIIRDKLWIINGSTHPITWDGTTATSLDGSGTLPDAPKGKYIEYWKERVWLTRTDTEPSAIYFSALTDDEGNDIDPSVSSQAWVATNALYINREDGSPIYGVKVYRDNLFVFKETGIWRVIFEDEYNIQVVKQVSNIGCKFQDTILEMDDSLLYFIGIDGLYAFNGYQAKRISDKWDETFKTLKQPYGAERYKLWDTAGDFNAGTLDGVSPTIASGYLSLIFSTYTWLLDDFTDNEYENNPTWSVLTGNGCNYTSPLIDDGSLRYYANPATVANPNCILGISENRQAYGVTHFRYSLVSPSSDGVSLLVYYSGDCNIYGNLPQNGIYVKLSYSSAGDVNIQLIKRINGGTPEILGENTIDTYGTISIERKYNNDISVYKDGSEIISVNDNFLTTSACSVIGYQVNQNQSADIELFDIYPSSGLYNSSGTYTSQVYNDNTLSLWRTFEAEDTLNGQSILYYIKTATSEYNLSQESFSQIYAGNIISTDSAKNYVQWKAELTTYDTVLSPQIDSVLLNYTMGDATINRMSARSFENRYYLTASSSSANQYNDMMIVKSRSPLNSVTLYDWDISAMTLWNGNFYGGIANTDKIARLEYGSNDNGSAIISWWISKDAIYGMPYYYKQINEILLDYEKGTNDSLKVSASADVGKSYIARTVDLSQAKYERDIKRLNYNLPMSPSARFKIYNDKLDYGYTIYGLHSFGKAYKFKGN